LFTSNIFATCRSGHPSSYDPSFVAALSMVLSLTGHWKLALVILAIVACKTEVLWSSFKVLQIFGSILIIIVVGCLLFENLDVISLPQKFKFIKYIQGA